VQATNLPIYPAITRSELSQYELDDASARAFERLFAWYYLGSAGLLFGILPAGWLVHRFLDVDKTILGLGAIAILPLGFGLVIFAHHRQMRTRPKSLRSGKEMEPFVIQDRKNPGDYELAYVDRASQTYFTLQYIEG
jgi:hypothetical protein